MTLLNGITQVVAGRAEEQVIGTNAGRVVTVVAHVESHRDRAVREFVGEAVRPDKATVTVTSGDPKDSVSVRGMGGSPDPARFRFLDLRPETRFDGRWSGVAVRHHPNSNTWAKG